MRSLSVTQENLDNQRSAVQEEKRLRYDNQPYVNGFLRLFEMCFRNHANAHSTIGSMEDLDAATVADIREFFRIYYAPNNAVLAIAGDFDMAATRAMIEKYFATIPSQPSGVSAGMRQPKSYCLNSENRSTNPNTRSALTTAAATSGSSINHAHRVKRPHLPSHSAQPPAKATAGTKHTSKMKL